MPTLTHSEIMKLRGLGIWQATFDMETHIEVTPKGLWHLFNFRQAEGCAKWKWDARKAKALAAYDFKSNRDFPAVTILLTDMPVHEDTAMYQRLTVYAHHSPVYVIQDFPPRSSIQMEYSVSSSSGQLGHNAIGLSGNWSFTIRLTKDELMTLLREKSLTITFH